MTWVFSAAVLTAYMVSREKRQRFVLMEIFSKHVSSDVAEDIWRQRDQFLENGRPRSQELTVTVLFSDLKGYTTVSERLTPNSLINWLNIYLDSMTKIIMEHSGVVDDYVGDGIKANFGVPLARNSEEEIRRDAVNAVECALAMDREMHLLQGQWRAKGLPEVTMRVGICTGPVVAGTVGSSQRMKYTTVGDTVNTAARLEGFKKSLAHESMCRILICESTLKYLGPEFKTEDVGEASLKGKERHIIVYRVLGRDQEQ
jgi:adenylate cyclase